MPVRKSGVILYMPSWDVIPRLHGVENCMIDLYERPKDAFYLIEVETQGQPDRDLYFAPDGTLLKDEADRENHEVTPDIEF